MLVTVNRSSQNTDTDETFKVGDSILEYGVETNISAEQYMSLKLSGLFDIEVSVYNPAERKTTDAIGPRIIDNTDIDSLFPASVEPASEQSTDDIVSDTIVAELDIFNAIQSSIEAEQPDATNDTIMLATIAIYNVVSKKVENKLKVNK